MKILFIKAKVNVDLDKILKKINITEKKIGLVTAVQFEDCVKKIKDKRFVYGGSILGCNLDNALELRNKVDAFLFVGSGDFHVLGLKDLGKKIYILNPLTKKFKKIDEKEFEILEKKKKGKLLKILNAKKLGILVCLKPGQNLFNDGLRLQKKLKKKSYLFLCNDVDVSEFENFPDIDMWINTACPRIEHGKLINMRDLPREVFR